MYNKKVLREAINNLDRTKAPAKKQDMIVDPMGQWKYPGQNTRIPGNDITMQGVPYPVWAVPNVGTPQMMYPEQDYYFPGADHVDEYPQIAQRGGDISIPNLNQYEDGGEYDLTQEEIDDLIAQGYEVEDLPEVQDGGNSVSPLEGNYISKVIMNRNRGTDFVDRAYALGANPGTPLFNVPDDEQFGAHMSHKMAYGEGEGGKTWMFPTVLNPNDEAIEVPGQYADYISSEGYKYATGMKQKGGFQDDINKHRQLLRDWTYGIDLGLINKMQIGGPNFAAQVGYAAAPMPRPITDLPEITVKGKKQKSGRIKDSRPEYAKGYYDPWGVPDNTLENIVEIFDPTGITSWNDVIRAEREFGKDSWQANLERLGALPLVGKAAKTLKALKYLPMTARQRRSFNTYLNTLRGMGITGRGTDAYQAYDEGLKQKGGFQDDINKRRKLLRDWTYGASIGTLHKAQEGESVIESVTPYPEAPEVSGDPNMRPAIFEAKDITVKAKGPEWARFQREYQKKDPWERFLQNEQSKYLRRHKGLNKAAGVTMDNFPEAEKERIRQRYDQKMNTYITRRLGQKFGFNPNRRGDWLDLLTPKEREIVAGSKFGSKLQPSAWSNFLSGARSIYNAIPDYYKPTKDITAPIPGLTTAENKERLHDWMAGADVFAPLDIPGIIIANKMKNMNVENPSWYSGELMGNVDYIDATLVNPLTYFELYDLPQSLISLGRGVAKGAVATGRGLRTGVRALGKGIEAGYDAAKNLKGEGKTARQFTTRGPIGEGTGTGLNTSDISKAIDDQINWITSEEYYKRRSANTGETYDQIYRDVNRMINNARDAKFNVNAKLPEKIQGQQTPRSLNTFWGPPTVDVSSVAGNPPMVLKHEVGHLYSPAGFDVDISKLHRGYDNPNVANLPANKRGVYANYPQLGDIALDDYLQLGFEQQVRHLNARDQILNKFNLPKDAQLTEKQVGEFLDDWDKKIDNRNWGWKDKDFNYKFGKEEDYDDLWKRESDLITQDILKNKYGIDDINNIYDLSKEQMAALKAERKKRMAKRITDVLNKAWVAVPAAVGVEAAATQGEPEKQEFKQRRPIKLEYGGETLDELDYEEIDLTPEEIDWYLANGYDLEDLGDSELFDDYLPEAQEGLVFKNKVNIAQQAAQKKVEPAKKEVVKKPVPVKKEPTPYEKIIYANAKQALAYPNKRPLPVQQKTEEYNIMESPFFAGRTFDNKFMGSYKDLPGYKEQKDETKPLKKLPNKTKSEEYVFPAMNLGTGRPAPSLTRMPSNQPIAGGMASQLSNVGRTGVIDYNKLKQQQKETIRSNQQSKKLKQLNLSFPEKVVETAKYLKNETGDLIDAVPGYIADETKYLMNQADEITQYGKRFLDKKGLINIEDYKLDPNKTKAKKAPIVSATPKPSKFYQELGEVPDSYDTKNKLLSYRNQWDNKDGFVYISTPVKKDRMGNEEYKNVKGVAHFNLDASPSDRATYMHPNNVAYIRSAITNNEYIPVYKSLGNDKVKLQYKKYSELSSEEKKNVDNLLKEWNAAGKYDDKNPSQRHIDIANNYAKQVGKQKTRIVTPLRQMKYDEIKFDKVQQPKGFQSGIKEVKRSDGQGTYLLFKSRDGYSRFSGGSVVFIFKDKYGNTIVRDYAGSLNGIENEGINIKKEYKLKPGELTIGYHDVGSFSAKPKADSSGVVRSSQWEGFNNLGNTGGALLIPNE